MVKRKLDTLSDIRICLKNKFKGALIAKVPLGELAAGYRECNVTQKLDFLQSCQTFSLQSINVAIIMPDKNGKPKKKGLTYG